MQQTGDQLWRNRSYMFLVASQAVSNLGDWLYILALLLLVGVRWHGSPAMLSITMLCLAAPSVLLGPFTGMLADRLNRTLLMIVSNVVMAILIGSIPFLTDYWELFAILVLAGAFESLFYPAEQGKLNEVVPGSQMDRAVAVNSSISQMAKIVGPGLSGALVSLFGANLAFYLDSASFILSSLILLFTGFASSTHDSHVSEQTHEQSESFRRRTKVGWHYIVRNRMLWTGMLLIVVTILVLEVSDSQFITLLRLLPRLSPNLFGDVMAASGLGALVSAVFVGKIRPKTAVVWIGIGALGLGCAFATEALIVKQGLNQWITTVAAFFAGGCASLGMLPFETMVQRQTPKDMIWRVFGVIGSCMTGAALMGPVLGGAIVTAFGAVTGFLVTGTGLVAIGIATFGLRRWIERGDVLTETRTG